MVDYSKKDINIIFASSGSNIESPDVTNPAIHIQGYQAGEKPFSTNINYQYNRFSNNIAYLNQKGIAEHDTNTEYKVNSFVQYLGNLYKATRDNQGNFTASNWKKLIVETEVPDVCFRGEIKTLYLEPTSAELSRYESLGWFTADGRNTPYGKTPDLRGRFLRPARKGSSNSAVAGCKNNVGESENFKNKTANKTVNFTTSGGNNINTADKENSFYLRSNTATVNDGANPIKTETSTFKISPRVNTNEGEVGNVARTNTGGLVSQIDRITFKSSNHKHTGSITIPGQSDNETAPTYTTVYLLVKMI